MLHLIRNFIVLSSVRSDINADNNNYGDTDRDRERDRD